MSKKRHEHGEVGLGRELEGLLASVPPPQAPAWFAAKTLARLRAERMQEEKGGWFWMPRWKWLATGLGVAVLMLGAMRWDRASVKISDAEVYAALNALVQEEEESRWWAGL
ncbi:hypothetical protein EBX31_12250 [bacterium]|nr:hypothetical protein [bacterium]